MNLKQFSEISRLMDKREEDNTLDILSIIYEIDKDKLRLLPTDTIKRMLQFDIPKVEPSNKLVINKEVFIINPLEKLKFGEYTDLDSLDRFDYPSMLAIIMRKPNEVYDDDFIANKLDERVKMYEQLDIEEALKPLNFFLFLKEIQQRCSQKSLEELREQAELSLQHIRSSLKAGGFKKLGMIYAKIRLKKLEKSLRCI